MPAVAITSFGSAMDPAEYPQSKQKRGDIVDEPATSRGVVDTPHVVLRVPPDRPIRRPKVPQEQRHLIVRRRENLRGHELFVAAQPEQPQPVQPRRDRVSLPA